MDREGVPAERVYSPELHVIAVIGKGKNLATDEHG